MRLPIAIVLLVGMVSIVPAAEKSSSKRYAVGDKVQVEWAGETLTGEVMKRLPNGWLRVKLDYRGQEITPVFPPERVERIKQISKRPKTAQNSGADGVGGTAEGARAGGEFRSWSDASGKFQITARFLELKDGKIRLEQKDGTTASIPVEKLSAEDRKRAETLAAGANENPFKAEEPAAGHDETQDSRATAPMGDWSGVQVLHPDETGPWSLKADLADTSEKLAPHTVVLHSARKASGKRRSTSFWTRIEGLLLAPNRHEAFAITSDTSDGRLATDRLLFVHRVDLATGKAAPPIELDFAGKPLDVDPAGRRIALVFDFTRSPRRMFDARPQIAVWELGGKKPRMVSSWDPTDAEQRNGIGKAPQMARFVDADHLLTLAFPSELVLWQVSTRRALYKLVLTGDSFALSPNHKYLAVGADGGVFVLDPLTGQTLGKLPSDLLMNVSLSFSQDGRQLAAMSAAHLVVWDLDTGESSHDVYFPTYLGSGIDWVSEEFLLVGGSKLVDLKRRIVLWDYRLAHSARFVERSFGEAGGVFWYLLGDSKRQGIVGAAIPHAAAREAAAALNPDELLVLKPGARLSLSLRIQASPADVQRATEGLTANLRQLGIDVVPDSPLVLTATTEGKSEQKSYRTIGARPRRFGGQEITTANATTFVARLRLSEGNKVYWEATSVSGAPMIVSRKHGQSLQQALDQYAHPNLDFFSTVKLPQYLARAGEGGAYGASELTDQGIRDVPVMGSQANAVPPVSPNQPRPQRAPASGL